MKKRTPIRVEAERGPRLRLFERNGVWWLDTPPQYSDTGQRQRESLRTSDRGVAEQIARERVNEIMLADLTGVKSNEATLAQVVAAYERFKLPHLSATRQQAMRGVLARVTAVWNPKRPVPSFCQTDVDEFCVERRAGHLLHRERAYRKHHPTATTIPAFPALRDGVLANDLRAMSGVFNWAVHKHRLPNGEPLLTTNPLRGLDKPRELNPRRPRASEPRYQQTLMVADEVDPLGRLRLMLVLAHDTARRVSAIRNARRSHFLLTPAAMRAAGLSEERILHSPFGVAAWSGEHDKEGKQRYTPIAPWTRAEIDRYLGKAALVGDAPMFPGHPCTRPGGRRDPLGPRPETRPMTRAVASSLLRAAERRAGLPKLDGGTWHPYRRAWAASRRDLPDQAAVARAGGWDSVEIMQECYSGDAQAATDYAVMNYTPPAPSSAVG